MPTFHEFEKFDIRVGTVIEAVTHDTARKPSYKLKIDFGDVGIKSSSAQLTKRYDPETLIGRQVVAVLNFPPRRVADFTSEVLVLGAMVSSQDVVLLQPSESVKNGTSIA